MWICVESVGCFYLNICQFPSKVVAGKMYSKNYGGIETENDQEGM